MYSPTNPRFRSFPENDKLYRIFWGGEILAPEAHSLTPRVRLWLKEIDEDGKEIPDGKIVQISESVGAIPRLAIGSHWRNGKVTWPDNLDPPEARTLVISPVERWEPIRAGDPDPGYSEHPATGRHRSVICPEDLRLSFRTSHGRLVHGENALVVVAKGEDGENIVIPSYEIFRALLANWSELSLALVSNKWDAVESRFVLSRTASATEEGIDLHLDLQMRASSTTKMCLAMYCFLEDARRAANHVHPALVRQDSDTMFPWISAFPPLSNRPFRLRAYAIPLPSRSGLLVNQIVGFDPMLDIGDITCTVPKDRITITEESGEGADQDGPPRTITVARSSDIEVSEPRDARPGNRNVLLPSMSVKWSGLPIPRTVSRTVQTVILPPAKPGATIISPPVKVVSVGETGTRKGAKPGSFSPEEERSIADRFEDIRELIEFLRTEKKIVNAEEYPLVRPSPADFPSYCEFPEIVDNEPCKWAIIRWPIERPRLAMVLEIELPERTVYWIETESVAGRDKHRSLALEVLSGDSLDEATLAALLDTCARGKGVWPDELRFGDGTIIYERARHNYVGKRLNASTMLTPFGRLKAQKQALRDSKLGVVTAERIAEPV